MTKEQEEAIEYLKKHIKYFEEQIKFIEATDCDYYDEELELYQNRVKQFNIVLSMLKEKDKIIQNMSKYILSLDIDKDICMKNTTNTELCNEDNSNCVECIIKHFSN